MDGLAMQLRLGSAIEKARNLGRVVSYIYGHPLNREQRLGAIVRFARWQVGSRLVPGSVAAPFVDHTRLLVQPGMAGATGNVYCGLHEFEDMSFALHLLRGGDLFVDVGANVGSYTVIAAGACGADVVAFEPVPETHRCLLDNVRLNDLDHRVDARNAGVGSKAGRLRFSTDADAANHVLSPDESAGASVEVPVDTLDTALDGRPPLLVKIDAEGFETEIIAGAATTLARARPLAVLMELNGSGARYGFDENALHRRIIELGLTPHAYEPFSRTLTPLDGKSKTSGNTLYLRDAAAILARVKDAPQRNFHGVIV